MRLYPRLASVALSNTVFRLIKPYVTHIAYWKGPKHAMRILKRAEKKKMPTSLNPYDEFVLTLMRLRLGLLNEDIPDCFHILPTKSSFIFTT